MADSAALDKRAARALDKALDGAAAPIDPTVAPLVDIIERLREDFSPQIPDSRAERALFVQAVGSGRKSWGWVRFFGPATVTAIALMVAIMLGRSALPGETFYPVRQALRAVGLAPFSLTEIDEEIVRAKELVAQAEGLKSEDAEQARALAFEAVKVLGFAEQLLPEVASDQAEGRVAEVQALLLRAQGILVPDAEKRGHGDGQDSGAGNDSERTGGDNGDAPRGNSGAVRNDRSQDDRGDNDEKHEDRDGRKDHDGGRDKQDDSHGSKQSPSSGADPREDEDDATPDEDGTDFDDEADHKDRDRDAKDRDTDGDKDDDETPEPEETDDLRRDVENRVRDGHAHAEEPKGGGGD